MSILYNIKSVLICAREVKLPKNIFVSNLCELFVFRYIRLVLMKPKLALDFEAICLGELHTCLTNNYFCLYSLLVFKTNVSYRF